MTAIGRQRCTSNSAIAGPSSNLFRTTAFYKHRATSVTPLKKIGTDLSSPFTAFGHALSPAGLDLADTGPLRHQQIRNYTKYSGYIYKTFTNKNGDTITHKQNLNPKDAKKMVLCIFAIMGIVVCGWFVLCYEIGNLIETVLGWMGKGISALLQWVWWIGCEVVKFLRRL